MSPITLTERAARRINEIMAAEPQGSMLRISVNGGGESPWFAGTRLYRQDIGGAWQTALAALAQELTR